MNWNFANIMPPSYSCYWNWKSNMGHSHNYTFGFVDTILNFGLLYIVMFHVIYHFWQVLFAFQEINDFRGGCGALLSFDWVSTPLVYTQVKNSHFCYVLVYNRCLNLLIHGIVYPYAFLVQVVPLAKLGGDFWEMGEMSFEVESNYSFRFEVLLIVNKLKHWSHFHNY